MAHLGSRDITLMVDRTEYVQLILRQHGEYKDWPRPLEWTLFLQSSFSLTKFEFSYISIISINHESCQKPQTLLPWGVQVWDLGSTNRSNCMKHGSGSEQCEGPGDTRALIWLAWWWGHLVLWMAVLSFRKQVLSSKDNRTSKGGLRDTTGLVSGCKISDSTSAALLWSLWPT